MCWVGTNPLCERRRSRPGGNVIRWTLCFPNNTRSILLIQLPLNQLRASQRPFIGEALMLPATDIKWGHIGPTEARNWCRTRRGPGLMLDAIAAVFLGMTMSRRGEPKVVYTLVGVLILGVLDNGMTQLRVDSYVREIFVGLIVLAAVAVASLSKRRNAK